jgi:HSP20 family protein
MFDVMAPETSDRARARFDVIERPERFEVKVDLPGAKKEDIRVDIHENQVRISANSVVTRDLKEGDRALRSERQTTHYGRSFELPQAVQEDAAQAAFENGVLTSICPSGRRGRAVACKSRERVPRSCGPLGLSNRVGLRSIRMGDVGSAAGFRGLLRSGQYSSDGFPLEQDASPLARLDNPKLGCPNGWGRAL